MTNDVRFIIRFASASCTSCSDSVSSAEVASSSTRIGAFLSSARAIASRCRWPPDSRWPALADHRLVAVRQRDDELVRVGGARRRLDLLRAGAPCDDSVRDVVGDRVVEQHRLLRHDADLPPQRGERHVAHVDAVDEDRARA